MNAKTNRVTVFDRGLGKIRPIGQVPLLTSAELGWSGFSLEHQKVPSFEGEDVVWTIATEVGFADQSHLTRQFKRFCGTTPKVFSRQHSARNPQHTP